MVSVLSRILPSSSPSPPTKADTKTTTALKHDSSKNNDHVRVKPIHKGKEDTDVSIEDILKEDRGEINRILDPASNGASSHTKLNNKTSPKQHTPHPQTKQQHAPPAPAASSSPSSSSSPPPSSSSSSSTNTSKNGKHEKDHKFFNPFSRFMKSSPSQVNLSSNSHKDDHRSNSSNGSAESSKPLTSRNPFSKTRTRGSTISMGQNYENHPELRNMQPIKTSSGGKSFSAVASPSVKTPKSAMKPLSVHNANPFLNNSPNHNPSTTVENNHTPSLSKASNTTSPMVYNPYGSISKTNTFNNNPVNSSRFPTSSSVNGNNTASATNTSLGFYLTDGSGEANLLPLPIECPNSYLPPVFKQNSEFFSDDFELVKDASSSVGKGASSDVRTVVNKHLSTITKKKIYCLKKLCMFSKEQPQHFYDRCAKEFIIAKTLDGNKHIITTYLLLKIPTTSYMSRGWGFIMEFCDSGDLFNLIVSPKWKKIPINEKFCLFKQISIGLNYIHSKGIAHKDIKPENILITHEGVAKITDFGVSEFGWNDPEDPKSGIKLSNAFVGSPPYTSPEVMVFKGLSLKEREKLTDKYYDPFKMDLWSLGLLFFTMVHQNTPFLTADRSDANFRDFVLSYSTFVSMNPKFKTGINPKEDPKSCISGPYNENKLGREFQDSNASRVAWKLCDPDPATRYSFEDLLYDPWFIAVVTCTMESDSDDHDLKHQHDWYCMNEPLMIPSEELYGKSAASGRNGSDTSQTAKTLRSPSTNGSVDLNTVPATSEDTTAKQEEAVLMAVHAEPTEAAQVPATKKGTSEPPIKEAVEPAEVPATKSVASSKTNMPKGNPKSQLSQMMKSNPMPSPFADSTGLSSVNSKDHVGSLGSVHSHSISRSSSVLYSMSGPPSSPSTSSIVQQYVSGYKEEKRKIKVDYMNKKVSHNHC